MEARVAAAKGVAKGVAKRVAKGVEARRATSLLATGGGR